MGEVDCQMVEVLGELAYFPVRNPPSCILFFIDALPRGPSTVTNRELMVTLTIRSQQISGCSCANALLQS